MKRVRPLVIFSDFWKWNVSRTQLIFNQVGFRFKWFFYLRSFILHIFFIWQHNRKINVHMSTDVAMERKFQLHRKRRTRRPSPFVCTAILFFSIFPIWSVKPWPNGNTSRRKLNLRLRLARTCAHWCWLAFTLVEIKFSLMSTQVLQFTSNTVAFKMVFCKLACTWDLPCVSVWPANASLYVTSTCDYLRPLALPFGQGFTYSPCE